MLLAVWIRKTILVLAATSLSMQILAWQCVVQDQYYLLDTELVTGEPLILPMRGYGADEVTMALSVKWMIYAHGSSYTLHAQRVENNSRIIILTLPKLAIGSYIIKPFCIDKNKNGCGRIFTPLHFTIIPSTRKWLRNSQPWELIHMIRPRLSWTRNKTECPRSQRCNYRRRIA